MKATTKTLREEHEWIQLLLDCVERLVEDYRERGEFDSESATQLQALLEHFVDGHHQEKEEAALFPKLMECVQKLQEDHVREREHLERMRFNLFNALLGDPVGREGFAAEAGRYVELQREHLDRESLGLLPLAEQLLTPADDEELLADFRRRESAGPDRARLRQRVARLCRHLGVPHLLESPERLAVPPR